ncbi:ORFL86W [Human betaherpesvirus 5]|nr:ORFL86W [Human betaherpesvirus 5]QHX40398.1 ORFL86W [Human betaherpesvirus 5]
MRPGSDAPKRTQSDEADPSSVTARRLERGAREEVLLPGALGPARPTRFIYTVSDGGTPSPRRGRSSGDGGNRDAGGNGDRQRRRWRRPDYGGQTHACDPVDRRRVVAATVVAAAARQLHGAVVTAAVRRRRCGGGDSDERGGRENRGARGSGCGSGDRE